MKTRRTSPLLCFAFLLLLELPALPCGPFFAEAVFVKAHAPDLPYERFVAGRLGVPQPGYRTRHLAVTYLYLSGHPLAPPEQQAAIHAQSYFAASWEDAQNDPAGNTGFRTWIAARNQFGPVDHFVPDQKLRSERGVSEYMFAPNCMDDAFATAARTLAQRSSAHGPHSPEVTEWVRGQDQVFNNCAQTSTAPAALPASAPLWLQQDRAYQQAATVFYDAQYEAAAAAFRTIAADTASPWSPLSRYLVARALTALAAQALPENLPLALSPAPPVPQPSPEMKQQRYLAALRAAQHETESARSDPRMRPYAHALDQLLDRINSRLDPPAQQRTLAMRLTATTPDPNAYQDLVDLSFLFDSGDALQLRPTGPSHPPALAPAANDAERRADDLLAFIRAFQASDEATSLERFTAAHTNAWLLAALTFAKPTDAAVPSLLAAAGAIPAGDPGFAAITYHRLRLAPNRPELLAVLPRIRASEGPSTVNLYTTLDAASAPTFNAWLAQAGRRPAAVVSTMDDEDEESDFDPKPTPQPCGPPVPDADTKLFAADAATILNARLPLRMLVQAAEDRALPPNLRFQIAQAAWTRAALLDRQATARRVAPMLIRCNSAWRPVLDAYNHASAPTDREATRLFALLRFASTEPNVREGEQRPEGFAGYSMYRDNWWCVTVPDPATGQLFNVPSEHSPTIPDPAFLTAADRAEASADYDALHKIPDASTYFVQAAVAFQHAHPHDPRTPDLLGQTFRLVRNACVFANGDNGDYQAAARHHGELEHTLFTLLHTQYPNSPWTRRYQVWDKGN